MGQPKRRSTKLGLGEIRESGKVKRFTSRDTIPVPPADREPATDTRRATVDIRMSFEEAKREVSTTPPASGPRPKAARDSIKRSTREALRVDAVEVTRARKITLREAVTATPRIVNQARIRQAPLDARDAFVLSLIDGKTAIDELADVAGIPEEDLERLLARFVRLGIVAM